MTEATNALSSIRAEKEQFYQDNRTYVGSPCSMAGLESFNITCTPVETASTYTIVATGSGPAAGFVYTINQAGVRATTSTATGWGGASTSCWNVREGGSC
ncbi:MAG: hypothetical protein FWC58_10825 [Desulfobulbus sp.]|nr:hypothetical protein [Desulfobulbus sp.]